MIFGIKEKSIILTHNVFLAIATIIPQQLKTSFVVQGHILVSLIYICIYIVIQFVLLLELVDFVSLIIIFVIFHFNLI